jgi:hypothetical protein
MEKRPLVKGAGEGGARKGEMVKSRRKLSLN